MVLISMPGRSTEENEKRVLCVKVTKMLILGSGGLFTAQVCEFNYSFSQAI